MAEETRANDPVSTADDTDVPASAKSLKPWVPKIVPEWARNVGTSTAGAAKSVNESRLADWRSLPANFWPSAFVSKTTFDSVAVDALVEVVPVPVPVPV